VLSLKEAINHEREDLQGVKRPYETAAFLIFAILFIQQVAYLVYHLVRFAFTINNMTFMSMANVCTGNNQGFVARIVNLDSNNWIVIILGIVAFAFYYFLIYMFVWNYCKRHGLAKWTWTVLVVFFPGNLLFMPAYMWFALYVFRPYIMRFIKRAVVEYKEFDPKHKFQEEIEEPVVKEVPQPVEPTE